MIWQLTSSVESKIPMMWYHQWTMYLMSNMGRRLVLYHSTHWTCSKVRYVSLNINILFRWLNKPFYKVSFLNRQMFLLHIFVYSSVIYILSSLKTLDLNFSVRKIVHVDNIMARDFHMISNWTFNRLMILPFKYKSR